MSYHFSKVYLGTCCASPYFQAHIPGTYPLYLELQRAKMHRMLPPNLRELSRLSREWEWKHWGVDHLEGYYDDEFHELYEGHRMTDEEVWSQWDGQPGITPPDIPLPEGGFPDPLTWEPPPEEEEEELWDRGLTYEQVLRDIKSRGIARAVEEYGLDHYEPDATMEEVARAIVAMEGTPRRKRGAPE